jgi:flavin reductase
MVHRDDFRSAMARLGAAVNIVTTDGPAGLHGLTVSAICSVTDEPPTLLVCVNRAARANSALKKNKVLCVNVLAAHHAALAQSFASRGLAITERFGDPSAWSRLRTGSPVLEDAVAVIDCRIASVHEVGTHSVFFCEVEAVHASGRDPGLIYFDRAYHCVPTRGGKDLPAQSDDDLPQVTAARKMAQGIG